MKLPCDIPVFQEFIDAGHCGHPTECAIALAVNDYFESKFKVEVHPYYVFVDHESYKTSHNLRKWIETFDKARGAVVPITLVLYEDEQYGDRCADMYVEESEYE